MQKKKAKNKMFFLFFFPPLLFFPTFFEEGGRLKRQSKLSAKLFEVKISLNCSSGKILSLFIYFTFFFLIHFSFSMTIFLPVISQLPQRRQLKLVTKKKIGHHREMGGEGEEKKEWQQTFT